MAKTQHQFQKNQKLTVDIESMAPGGQGFTKKPGIPIFINRAVPGDSAEIELYDLRKDFAHARISRLLTPSNLRAEPPCKLFKVCGGCQWQHIGYEHQLNFKTDIVKQAIQHIGHLNPQLVLPTIGARNPFYYRNKVQFPVAQPKNSTRILAGYYKEGSHELVNIKHCPVQPEPLDHMLEAAKDALEKHGFDAYDENNHNGLIRHICGRYSFSEEQTLLTFVINANNEQFEALRPGLSVMAEELLEGNNQIAGISINLNPGRGNRIMGTVTIPLAGSPFLIENLRSDRADAPPLLSAGVSFRLSPTSFFQVNSDQAALLLDLVLDAVKDWRGFNPEQPVPLIVDAYAGVGTIAFWLSTVAERVLAVEEVPDAVTDGEEIRALNEIENVEFCSGTVEEIFPQFLADGLIPQIIVLDPPRKGVPAEVLQMAAAMAPERIIYVSCNPATLARDLERLKALGYESKSIQPLDMFPQTHHVESVTVIDRVHSA